MIGLIGCSLLALTMAGQTAQHAIITRDTLPPNTPDTSFRYHSPDSATIAKDSVISLADDAPAKPAGATTPANATTKNAGRGITTKVSSSDPAATTVTVINKDTVTDPSKADGKQTDPKTDAKPDEAKTDTKATEARSNSGDTTAEDRAEETKRELDRRWFISPLLKFQFQDFAMLEKNRKGYLSDANTLPFFQRGNASFAASAYKNLTQRLSISADLGLSFGHATSNDVLISQTPSKTYNLLNAALYYHLISPAYRLQPYVTIGINDIINDKSYPTLPMGVGAKFNSRKIMVMGQVSYGQSISKNVASTTMYTLGIYIPIKSKKQKQLDQDNDSPRNKDKDEAKKKDTVNKNGNGSVTNNIYITINLDSILKAKGLLDDNGNPIAGNGGGNGNGNNGGYANGRRRRGASGGGGGDGYDDDGSPTSRRKRPFKSLGLDDFTDEDYKIDSLDGKPTVHFIVYFEFNEYGLNSKAFGAIDKVISHLKRSSEFTVEIKGYTDSVGTDQYNNMLSRQRAKMVLDYMNSRGVPTELMKARAYGSDNPVADNSDPNQAWLNRRAEIIVHRKDVAAQ